MYFDQKEFGLRVKHLRRKHSLTQEQLADALYITATHLSKIECGQRGISIDLLLDLAAELDVSVDFLISGNPRTMGSVRMLIAQIRELLNCVESSEMD
ncbi:MAG: helix-turn-helix transcriptional regulator [Oscillospiraceae bacterium]